MSTIVIGRRRFKSTGERTTLRHDLAIQGQINRAGLTRMQLREGETEEEFARRVVLTGAMNGDILLLLGHLLLPEENDETDWTPAMSEEIAAFLGSLREPEEKAAVQTQIASMLQGFIVAGVSVLWTSASASLRAQVDAGDHETAA